VNTKKKNCFNKNLNLKKTNKTTKDQTKILKRLYHIAS